MGPGADAGAHHLARVLLALPDASEASALARALEARGIPATAVAPEQAARPAAWIVGVVVVDATAFPSPERSIAALERALGPEVRLIVLRPDARTPLPASLRARAFALPRPIDTEALAALARAALDAHGRSLEVRALARELEAALHSREDFLSILSHELRTPLTPILGWTQILRRGVADAEKLRAGLDVIERNARQQATIVNDLLDLSRAQHGTLELEVGTIELRALALQQTLAHSELAAKNGQTLALEGTDTGEPIYVRGDGERLAQVLGHLVGNALKFTPRGGTIGVRVWSDDTSAFLEVADTGVGIEPALLDEMFRVFWQAESGTKRRKGGLGVGLALTKHLVEAHGGTIVAASPGHGGGATFTVTLPRAVVEAASSKAIVGATVPAEGELGAGRLILVVEDDEDTRVALAELLVRAGYEVALASNGREGLERAEALSPAVVITDLAMPAMDGFELARALQQHATLGGTPVIALSGQGQRIDPATARRLGFADYLLKPTSVVALLGSVQRAVSNAEAAAAPHGHGA